MESDIVLRPMRLPQDCEGVARVRSGCFPAWTTTAQQVAAAEARRLPERLHIARVAAIDACIVGYGYVEEPGIAARPGRIRLRVLVDPAHRRAGIGSALYEALLERARDVGANELLTEALEDAAEAHPFLLHRGFVEYHRRVEGRLPLAKVNATAIGRGIDAHTDMFFGTGIRIATYRQLQLALPDAPRRLYDLDAALWEDIPFGLTGSIPSFAQYVQLELADPDFLPPASFVALKGDRWIGLAALMNGRGFLLNSVTGVVRDWRRRGLARWLKLHTIRYALECGATEIRTFNDGVNDAILELNRSLGFTLASTEIRYRKDLG